jgi:uncharacterized protein YcgI (DUF1989 family)
MKGKKRTDQLYMRCSPEFYFLLNYVKDCKKESTSDILHKALADYARHHYWGRDLDDVLKLCDAIEKT